MAENRDLGRLTDSEIAEIDRKTLEIIAGIRKGAHESEGRYDKSGEGLDEGMIGARVKSGVPLEEARAYQERMEKEFYDKVRATVIQGYLKRKGLKFVRDYYLQAQLRGDRTTKRLVSYLGAVSTIFLYYGLANNLCSEPLTDEWYSSMHTLFQGMVASVCSWGFYFMSKIVEKRSENNLSILEHMIEEAKSDSPKNGE